MGSIWAHCCSWTSFQRCHFFNPLSTMRSLLKFSGGECCISHLLNLGLENVQCILHAQWCCLRNNSSAARLHLEEEELFNVCVCICMCVIAFQEFSPLLDSVLDHGEQHVFLMSFMFNKTISCYALHNLGFCVSFLSHWRLIVSCFLLHRLLEYSNAMPGVGAGQIIQMKGMAKLPPRTLGRNPH